MAGAVMCCRKAAHWTWSPETAHLRSKAGGALIGGELEPGGNGERAPKVGGSMYDGTPCGGTTVVTGFSGPMMALSASGTCLGGWDPKFAVTRPALRHFGVSHHHLIQLQSGSNASSPFFEEGPDVSPFVHRLWSRTSSLACGLAPRENLDATCTAHYLREEVPSIDELLWCKFYSTPALWALGPCEPTHLCTSVLKSVHPSRRRRPLARSVTRKTCAVQTLQCTHQAPHEDALADLRKHPILDGPGSYLDRPSLQLHDPLRKRLQRRKTQWRRKCVDVASNRICNCNMVFTVNFVRADQNFVAEVALPFLPWKVMRKPPRSVHLKQFSLHSFACVSVMLKSPLQCCVHLNQPSGSRCGRQTMPSPESSLKQLAAAVPPLQFSLFQRASSFACAALLFSLASFVLDSTGARLTLWIQATLRAQVGFLPQSQQTTSWLGIGYLVLILNFFVAALAITVPFLVFLAFLSSFAKAVLLHRGLQCRLGFHFEPART